MREERGIGDRRGRFGLRGIGRWPAVAAGLLFACQAVAQSAPTAAIEQLDSALVQSMKMGQSAGFAARAKVLTPVIDAAFDLPGILKVVVGPQWSSMSADQQAQLLAAFRAFTVANYAANFASYSGQTITIVPPTRAVGPDQIVETTIMSGGKGNRIDYQMRPGDGGWKISDVLLDGTISNVALQRSDFRRLLASGNPQMLISMLNQHAAALGNAAPR